MAAVKLHKRRTWPRRLPLGVGSAATSRASKSNQSDARKGRIPDGKPKNQLSGFMEWSSPTIAPWLGH